MPRNQLNATPLVLIATLLAGPTSPALEESTRAAVASWLADNATVILMVLGAWIGLALMIGAAWALTYGRVRRTHRGNRPNRSTAAGSDQEHGEPDQGIDPPENGT